MMTFLNIFEIIHMSKSMDSEQVKYDKLNTDVSEETIKDVYRKVISKKNTS